MAQTLNSYEDVKNHLNQILTANDQMGATQFAPHGDWWNSMTYEEFVSGNVPGDIGSDQPMPILVRGNSAQSNIVMALQGTAGTPFDPETGSIGQMPASGPLFTKDQIQPLADWIDAGCPDGVVNAGAGDGGGQPPDGRSA